MSYSLPPIKHHAELQMSREDIFLIAILVGNDYDKVRIVIYILRSTNSLSREASRDAALPWHLDSQRAAWGISFLLQ